MRVSVQTRPLDWGTLQAIALQSPRGKNEHRDVGAGGRHTRLGGLYGPEVQFSLFSMVVALASAAGCLAIGNLVSSRYGV